jgi:integrase
MCFWVLRHHLKYLKLLAFHGVRGARMSRVQARCGVVANAHTATKTATKDGPIIMITEAQIKAAVRAASAGKSRTELHDRGARGAGRLVLVIRGKGTVAASSAEFFACWYRDGKRVMSKLGSHPTISLADARRRFREEFAPAISAGGEPTSAAARRRHRKEAGTVAELCDAYVASLRAAGKRTANIVERSLKAAAKTIGPTRPAAEVAPGDIVPHLAAIHDRGAKVHAAMVRAYLRAAFAYGLQSEHSYTQAGGARWGLTSNPVIAIPVGEGISNPRNRFLTPAEVRTLWNWLETLDVESKFPPALRLMLATGQRSEEILRITAATYETSRGMLYWPTTKNGLPHSIPVPHQAVAILEGLHANAHGLFFPCGPDPTRPAPSDGLGFVVQRFLEEHPEIPHFIPRDSRRTWKTLSGDAGLSKEMRDRLQNHSKTSDVSTRHYDRYDYLPERRSAMAKWATYLDSVLSGEIKEVGQRESNVVPIGAAALASAGGAAGR